MTLRLCYLALALLLAACIAHEPGLDPAADGGEALVRKCSGPAGTRGGCAQGEVCGSLPEVGFDYCLPAPPCPPAMVSVIDLGCAYPCRSHDDCGAQGLQRCAENALRKYNGGPAGWCAP